METVAIIDYGSGNLRSAAKAFERAAHEAGLAREIVVTENADVVAGADRVVLPGVGAFRDCREGLVARDGMLDALHAAVRTRAQPFLGICVGMQLMATRGLEHGETPGFGWISGDVVPITPSDAALKIPHMGWNELEITARDHPLLSQFAGQSAHAYFVHSYQLVTENDDDVLARVEYGGAITAAVGRDNMIGTQFHPEKSQATGLALIEAFLRWAP
ncbi:MAG: imidazole glycerol phosphate synthase subunit HisH [Rhodospirillaceae bacterium]|jgi:glutamine amidotransferase|nr:imidazole glycerol phosphate synthase subunit HisH [Rhodospirillaceae bacterium]MBT5943918.1 imidazole glycerol phosphate synthase subunit HisH [Rhodospirillaceae bacterium]MBT6402959.1 imidazole glycerol phosphate synthase subunit HisH [Rhodospirillaceae bacterium]MBT6537036.1 imidazole glycerol phosphate synthase subunit HisH [Rhodospirillaceae bacterium]MBT7362332.1 imidazole glycerol phosphate synthase subunit HisH [Rhodospirillaceae bacterium]